MQAAFTIGLGLSAYRAPWLGLGCVALAFGWSTWMTRTTWRRGFVTGGVASADCLLAVVVLAGLTMAIPPQQLTTSFNWALPYVQSAAMVPAALPSRRTLLGVALVSGLCVVYLASLTLGHGGAGAALAGTGNAGGVVAHYLAGLAGMSLIRRHSRQLDQAYEEVREQGIELETARARLEEFRRLHDGAVQVLERAAVFGEPFTADLRRFAREASHELRLAMQRDRGHRESLDETLRGLVEGCASRGLRVWLQSDGAAHDLEIREVGAIRDAVREALTNVGKHAGVDAATVHLKRVSGGGLEVRVEDRGAGFDVGAVQQGFGIANSITGRIEELGGTVSIKSSVGAGAVVSIRLRC